MCFEFGLGPLCNATWTSSCSSLFKLHLRSVAVLTLESSAISDPLNPDGSQQYPNYFALGSLKMCEKCWNCINTRSEKFRFVPLLFL